MKKLQKAFKVEGKHLTYKTKLKGMRSFAFNASSCFRIVEYKGQPRVVTHANRWSTEFQSCQIMGPSEAKRLIAWLARYVALCDKRNPAAFLFTDSHARLNSTKKNLDELARFFGTEE